MLNLIWFDTDELNCCIAGFIQFLFKYQVIQFTKDKLLISISDGQSGVWPEPLEAAARETSERIREAAAGAEATARARGKIEKNLIVYR